MSMAIGDLDANQRGAGNGAAVFSFHTGRLGRAVPDHER